MTLKTILLVIAVATVIGCESRLTFEELMKQGEQYSAEGNTEKSIEAYKKAVAQSPEDTSAHEALGVECQDIDNDFKCHDIANTQLIYRSL